MSVVSCLFRGPWAASLVLLVSLSAQASTVDLLKAGEGEKAILRASPTMGAVETFNIVLDMDMKMDMGDMGQLPTDLPPLEMNIEAKVDKVETNGNIHYSYVLKDIAVKGEADPMLRAALEKQLPTMQGTVGSYVITNRGLILKSELKAPDGADPNQVTNMNKGMNHASAAFPEEPVGIGGRWRVTQSIKDNGLDLDQTVVYTLKERKGNKVVLGTELIQKPAPDAKLAPGLEGASASLVKFTSMGDGETTLDLTRLFPTKASMKHYLNSLMAVNQGGKTMNVGLEMEMKMDMERK